MLNTAIISFGIFTGALSGALGLNIVDEPVKYLVINIPAVFCFGSVIYMLEDRNS